jgi:hypothetical protein
MAASFALCEFISVAKMQVQWMAGSVRPHCRTRSVDESPQGAEIVLRYKRHIAPNQMIKQRIGCREEEENA